MIRSVTSRLNATRFAIALLAFGCAFASALTGLHLTHMLPEHHLRRRQSLDRAVARCCCSAWATSALTSESRLPRHCESFSKRGAIAPRGASHEGVRSLKSNNCVICTASLTMSIKRRESTPRGQLAVAIVPAFGCRTAVSWPILMTEDG